MTHYEKHNDSARLVGLREGNNFTKKLVAARALRAESLGNLNLSHVMIIISGHQKECIAWLCIECNLKKR